MAKNQFEFVEVKSTYWIPESVGDSITGVVLEGGTIDTEYGEAEFLVVEDLNDASIAYNVLVSGGLQALPKNLHNLVRLTYEGEKENLKAKKGRNKYFKSYKLEVAKGFDYNAWALNK